MNQDSNNKSYQYSTFNEYPPNTINYPPAPAKTNGKAIAALVLGIVAVVIPYIGFLFGIVGIIFASMSLKELKTSHEQGKGLAIAGLVTGIVGTALWGIVIGFIVIALILFSSVSDFNNFSNF